MTMGLFINSTKRASPLLSRDWKTEKTNREYPEITTNNKASAVTYNNKTGHYVLPVHQREAFLYLIHGQIMKRIITVLIVSSVSCPVFAAYVETRRNATIRPLSCTEVILRAGYNFDMGAGLMFTNAYNVGKWDELKPAITK